ncbi:hypothetical protein [Streptomyces sp. AM 2-1-1]|uniref:hypothetical protein n=1 Tax=Streptomyces sp. AM 2-1-1 TaxID=3028709 RepID=UPI0023B94BC2|nr:hypothetical protein [Streptomyces sp. AM 2-1-1]WEH40194.1 hypothetical protein PZB77_12090 [Streptomyces sp. AM 2-1-1]
MTTTKPSLVQKSARNNAAWCAVMSRTHGVPGEFGAQAWAAPVRTPLYHPDAVTLLPGADPAGVVGRIDLTTPGATVKDSFADLDLTAAGFRVLFEAEWIHRPAGPPTAFSGVPWEVAEDPDSVRAWAHAWDGGDGNADLFRPALLDDPGTFLLTARAADGTVTAGAVASRGEGGPGEDARGGSVLGLSNVFARDGGADAAWPGALDAAHRLFPGLPVVGYEHGEDLDTARRHGFTPAGPLRVWLHG